MKLVWGIILAIAWSVFVLVIRLAIAIGIIVIIVAIIRQIFRL